MRTATKEKIETPMNDNLFMYRAQLPKEIVYEGARLSENYRTRTAIVYSPDEPQFFVFKIVMNGQAEVLGELIETTTSLQRAMDLAAKQEG
jgi:hypothetical protein